MTEVYQGKLNQVFVTQYETVHRLEVNKLRNAAKFFSHLLHTNSISWSCLGAVRLTEEDTTAASRIFIKILMQDIAENLGVSAFVKKLADDDVAKSHMGGVFPKDCVENARFAVNFFTSIGLGALTVDLREFIADAPNQLLQQKYAELLAQAEAAENEDDSNSSSGDSSSSSSESSSSSDSGEARGAKQKHLDPNSPLSSKNSIT